MIPGDIITIPQDISNAATAKTVFEAFGKRVGVFLTRKNASEWENNRIVYMVIGPYGTISQGNAYRFRDGRIDSIGGDSTAYDAIAKTGDEYYFLGDAL